MYVANIIHILICGRSTISKISLLFLNTTVTLTDPPPPPSLTLIFFFPSIASFLETAPRLSLPWCPSQAHLPQISRYRGARVQTVSRSLRECSGADPRAWAAGAALAAREVLQIVLVWVRGEVWARYEGRVRDVDVVWLRGVDELWVRHEACCCDLAAPA